MKLVSQITSFFLATYFIAVPSLLGFHSLDHQHAPTQKLYEGVDTLQTVSFCSFCSVFIQYQGQSALLQVFEYSEIRFVNLILRIITNDVFVSIAFDINCLRGPPCA